MSLQSRVPDEYYFRWLNNYLREFPVPKPGYQCVICAESLPQKISRIHLHRGVCSKACSSKKIRKVKRLIEKKEIPHFSNLILDWPDIVDEMARPPKSFGEDEKVPFSLEIGRWVKDGDEVVRDGVVTKYSKFSTARLVHPELTKFVLEVDPTFERTLILSDGTNTFQSFVLTDATGRPTSTEWPVFALREPVYKPLFYRERILHVDDLGIPYIWNTPVFAIYYREKFSTTARLSFNLKMAAANAARNSYRARTKSLGITDSVADLVDVESLKLRHSGFCPLCGSELDWNENWPGDFYPTIDHIIPVSKGGKHSMENLQWVHWTCNLRKRDH